MNILPKMIVLSVLLGTAGCASTRRSVTHIRIEDETAYVAYAEWDEGFMVSAKNRSRVKRCEINSDNSMKCEEDADINYALNPQEGGKPPPRRAPAPKAEPEAAPAEAAPAADAAPAES